MSRWGIELSEFALVTLQKRQKIRTLYLFVSLVGKKVSIYLIAALGQNLPWDFCIIRDKSHFVKKIIQLCSSCFVYFSAKMTLEDESEL